MVLARYFRCLALALLDTINSATILNELVSFMKTNYDELGGNLVSAINFQL